MPGFGSVWRRGVPLVVGLAALAAVVAGVGWLWELEATRDVDRVVPLQDAAVAAAVFAATLLGGWALVGRDVPTVPSPSRMPPPRRAEVLAAALVIVTGVVLAAHGLDARLEWDEGITLTAYATQPFSVAVSKYNDPNNHVLHTLLAWSVHKLVGWNRVAFRLPAFLSFCLLLPALWWFVRQEYGPVAARLATALAAVSPFFLSFAASARGYTLLLLMFVTSLLCARALVRNPEKKTLWAAWAAAVALGLFTVPLMAFCAGTTVAWMLLARWGAHRRDALGPFLTRTAAWSVVAVLAAAVLYLPVLAAHDVLEVGEFHRARRHSLAGSLPLPAHPVAMWRDWHLAVPAWAQGVLLALVVVGAAVPGRTGGRRAALLSAAGLATCLLLLAYPFVPHARMFIWALLVLTTTAGVGAAVLVERAAFRASERWRGVWAESGRRALECCVVALLLGVSSWWATRPDALIVYRGSFRPLRSLLAMASSVDEHMRPGDYFTACRQVERPTLFYLRESYPFDKEVGAYSEAASQSPQNVHRVSAPEDRADGPGGSASPGSALPGEAPTERLFLLEATTAGGRRRCDRQTSPAWESLEAQWPDHEVVAAFHDGRVYALNGWSGAS